MSLFDSITQVIYNESFLIYLGAAIVLLALVLLVIIFIDLRVKKTVKIKLNEKGISYLKSIDQIRKIRNKPQQEIKELNALIKDFLKSYLKINFTPTYGEALEMIENRNNLEDIKQLCEEASAIMYAGEKPTEETIFALIEMFENIIKYRLIKLDEEKAKEIEKILGKSKEEFIDERKIRTVMGTIKSGKYDLAKSNLHSAYKSYSVVTAIFKNMNPKEKSICKNKIFEFYTEILKKANSIKSQAESQAKEKKSKEPSDNQPLPI